MMHFSTTNRISTIYAILILNACGLCFAFYLEYKDIKAFEENKVMALTEVVAIETKIRKGKPYYSYTIESKNNAKIKWSIEDIDKNKFNLKDIIPIYYCKNDISNYSLEFKKKDNYSYLIFFLCLLVVLFFVFYLFNKFDQKNKKSATSNKSTTTSS